MKNFKILTLAALATCAGQAFAGYKVAINETPVVVQNAIHAEAGTAQIEDIDRDIKNGKVLYSVAFKRNGQNTEILLNDQGQKVDAQGNVGGTSVPLVADSTRKIRFDQVPLAAQNAILAQAQSASIEDIDQENRKGRTTYAAAYKRNGRTVETKVTEDGATIMRLTDLPIPVQTSLRQKAGTSEIEDVEIRPRGSYTIHFVDGHSIPMTLSYAGNILNPIPGTAIPTPATTSAYSTGTARVSLNEVPSAARAAILARAGTAPVENISRTTVNGQTTYNITYRQNGIPATANIAEDGALIVQMIELPPAVQNTIRAQLVSLVPDRIEKRSPRGQDQYVVRYTVNGQTSQLRIGSDGRVLTGGYNTSNAVGSAPSGVIGSGSSITSLPDQKVTMAEVPVAAQNAINAVAGGAVIEDIDRQTRNGQTTYNAAFKRNGQTVEVTVTGDGVVTQQP